jgi:Predicted membrane protein (DUF2207)
MAGVPPGPALLGFLTEPARGPFVLSIVLTFAAVGYLLVGSRVLRPARIVTTEETSEIGPETPAVASLLTNGFTVTPNAVVATLFDLAARGWVRIVAADDEVIVLTDGHGSHGDVLSAYEQQILNHLHRLTAGTVNGVTGAGIEIAGLRLERRWWRRFTAAVAADARRQDLCRRRWNALFLVVPAALVGVAGWQLWRSVREGDETAVSESLLPRAAAGVLAVAIVIVAWRVVKLARSQAQRPTPKGTQRATVWMSLRAWMEPRGFAGASSVVANNPSRALGYAAAFGLAERAAAELPVVPEDDRTAWSNAAGPWHVVKVRYPFRPGFGRHPLLVLITGLVLGTGIILLQKLLLDIARGYTLGEFIDDNFADQENIIHNIAIGFAAVLVLPLLWMLWLVVAGAFDLFATIERRGLVVRARRPQRVIPYPWLLGPLARRDRYSLFVAVDDGRSDRVSAWLANERTAVPQGARARVRATPLLGYVRSAEPIGTQ